jgi:UDP-N-acetylmuramyl pentapeptide phosphotransferase/UDP-N-acetylglucosamine-1-phosphate transferase
VTGASLGYAAAIMVLTLVAGIVYRILWLRRTGLAPVPTGFGALLAFVMLGGAFVAAASAATLASLSVIAAATAIYWLDDAIELSARLRLALAFLTGAATALFWFGGDPGVSMPALIGLCALAGIICVVLTQIANFQDGADLNLASFIGLTSGCILAFSALRHEWAAIALAALTFVLPFGALNSRPRTLYLGDSGSFAFAGLLTVMAVAFVEDFRNMPPEAAIPAALPALDVFYVFVVRLKEKHDLLTRNYLHLYQRLNRRYRGFFYLVPQFLNVARCLAAAAMLERAGLGRILSVVVAMVLVTTAFYFACRRIFLAGAPEGPLHETSR